MAIRTHKTIGPFSPRAGLTTVLWATAAAAAVVGSPLAASAQVTIKFPTVVPSDNFVPDGPAPWLTAVINDIAADVVSITLTPSFVNASGSANFISQVVFKLGALTYPILPAYIPTGTNSQFFTAGSYPGSGDCVVNLGGTFNCGASSAESGESLVSITGGGVPNVGAFDFKLSLPPPPGGDQNVLNQDDVVTFYVTASGLTSSDFGTDRNTQNWTACAKVQGIGNNADDSSVICDGIHNGEKVPGPLPLLGAAAAFGYSRKIRTRIQGSRQQASIS